MYVLNMAIEWVYNYLYIYMYDELLFMLIKNVLYFLLVFNGICVSPLGEV
jgi:hypothetical protein